MGIVLLPVRSTSMSLLLRVAKVPGLSPRLFPSVKHPFNSTLALAVPQEQRFNAAGSGSVRDKKRRKVCHPALPSAGSRSTGLEGQGIG